MNLFNIGIIEDTRDELLRIQRTIFFEIENTNNKVDYKWYDFNCNDFDSMFGEIIEDIKESKISLLIIDNKILCKNGSKYDGTYLYERIRNVFQKFPMIILTNYKDEAYNSPYVDPDKVYQKERFFSGGNYTSEKVDIIFKNIIRYENLKKQAITKNEQAINDYVENIDPNMEYQLINAIMTNEQELDKYSPVDTSYLEKVISLDEIKDIVAILDDIMKKVE